MLDWVDERLAGVLPPVVTIALWALVAGIVCLELYRIVSPQERIEGLKQETRSAQRELSSYDGELDGAWPLIGHLLGVSLKRVGIVLPATLVAAYPIIAVLVWMSNSYGYYFPVDEAVPVETPAPLEARWFPGASAESPKVQARGPDGEIVVDIPVTAPVPMLHKHQWWNWLIANPAGYLPSDAPVERIGIELPKRQIIRAGPWWLRGWEAVFVPVLFVSALAYKSARRIH